jgi:uncharacterized protein HemX
MDRQIIEGDGQDESLQNQAHSLSFDEKVDWLRSQWQFAATVQFLHLFADPLKLDRDVDTEVRIISHFDPRRC